MSQSHLSDMKREQYRKMKDFGGYKMKHLCKNPVFSALFIIFFEEFLLGESDSEFERIKPGLTSVEHIQFDFLESIQEARNLNRSGLDVPRFRMGDSGSSSDNRKSRSTEKPGVKGASEQRRTRGTRSKQVDQNENENESKSIEEKYATPKRSKWANNLKSDVSIKDVDKPKENDEEYVSYNQIIYSSKNKSKTPNNSLRKLEAPDNSSLHDFYQKKEDHQIHDYFKYKSNRTPFVTAKPANALTTSSQRIDLTSPNPKKRPTSPTRRRRLRIIFHKKLTWTLSSKKRSLENSPRMRSPFRCEPKVAKRRPKTPRK